MRQQILPLKKAHSKTFANFTVGTNQAIIHALKDISSTSSLYLWGQSGTGLTHLLKATCAYWQKKNLNCLYLDLLHTDSKAILSLIENVDLVAIDNLDQVIRNKSTMEILFHVFNRGVQMPFGMVWGAHQPVDTLGGVLADLQSRLSSCLNLHIQPLDDDEKQMVLTNYADRLGLELKPAVAKYLIRHYSRSLQDQIYLLEKLDRASLELKRKISISLLKCELLTQS